MPLKRVFGGVEFQVHLGFLPCCLGIQEQAIQRLS